VGFDQLGVAQNFQMMGDGAGRQSIFFDDLAAKHCIASRNRLINAQARGVAKGAGHPDHLFFVHSKDVTSSEAELQEKCDQTV
jgi:hypothetical protein